MTGFLLPQVMPLVSLNTINIVGIDYQERADINKTALAIEDCAMPADIQIRKIKPTDKPQKLSDGGGLFLPTTQQGGKFWRFSYRFTGKQKTLSIGEYPYISIAEARKKREEATLRDAGASIGRHSHAPRSSLYTSHNKSL